ncbi:unnamed protein product [Trichobilharzia szidati]|nr:unnamed protein product [Trichobilharzia szidati]
MSKVPVAKLTSQLITSLVPLSCASDFTERTCRELLMYRATPPPLRPLTLSLRKQLNPHSSGVSSNPETSHVSVMATILGLRSSTNTPSS